MRNWLEKLQIKGFVTGVLVTMLLSGTFLVAANTQNVIREITYGIGVILNGQVVQFNEDSRPFVMGGRTFLPLRALAELLDMPVDFEPATNMAIVGSAVPLPRGTSVGELFFDGTSHARAHAVHAVSGHRVEARDSVVMGGNTFNDAVAFHTQANVSPGIVPSTVTQSAMFNLNGRYTWFNGNLGRVNGTRAIGAIVNIFVDERLVETFEQQAQLLPTEIRLFVEGARSVRIEVIYDLGNGIPATFAFAGRAE